MAIDRETAALEAAKQLFYLQEMTDGHEMDLLLGLIRRSLRRVAVVQGSRADKWAMVRRETLEALEYEEPTTNLPARGRLFSHFYIGVRYVCTTARLSENAHQAVKKLLQQAIVGLEVEYKGHVVSVHEVHPQG
jgi:hypothetical protein